MSKSKSNEKHVVRHAKKKTKTATGASAEGSTLHLATTEKASPEVSTPAPTLVTSAPALAPAIAAAAPPITPPGDLPPAVGAPQPPAGWVAAPGTKRSPKGLRPRGAQISNAVAAAKEITESATYAADFGSRAPAAGQVAFVVTNAAKWRAVWHTAKAFLTYASEQRATWENDALAQMDALKPAFNYAASRDGTVTEKYSATAKYLAENSQIAERGAAQRKEKAKANKAKANAGNTATAAAPATPAAPPAPAVIPATDTTAVAK
jgi:hypothetical protein